MEQPDVFLVKAIDGQAILRYLWKYLRGGKGISKFVFNLSFVINGKYSGDRYTNCAICINVLWISKI